MMMSAGFGGRSRFPFTISQWQELEHQALVYKYLISGMPIPPDLLFTIRRSLDSSISSKFLLQQLHHHHTIGWSGNFHMWLGRKIDPEPGRCRRTDGKKWRCSKDVYPDSKYCERHMHRGRNRSRKPVEVLSQPRASDSLHLNTSISTPFQDVRKNRGSIIDEQQNSLLCESGSSNSNSGTITRAENDVSWKLGLSQIIQNSGCEMKVQDHIHKNDLLYNFSEQPKKMMHHFLDEWALKDSHEIESTQLSNYMHDFFTNPKW